MKLLFFQKIIRFSSSGTWKQQQICRNVYKMCWKRRWTKTAYIFCSQRGERGRHGATSLGCDVTEWRHGISNAWGTLRSSRLIVLAKKILFLSIGDRSNVCAWLHMAATNHCVPIPVHKYLSETAKGNFCIDSTKCSLGDKMWVTVFSPMSQVLRARLFRISAIWNQ